MKDNLNFAWRSCNIRPLQSYRADVVMNRRVFGKFIQLAIENGARFVYIDEMSVCSRHLSFRSWVNTKVQTFIKAPPQSSTISVIGAISESGSLDCVMRKGTNKEEEVLEFLLDLDAKFQERHGPDFLDFRKKSIILADNATYHKTSLIKDFAKRRGVQIVTLPQYTPEWNPIERVWGIVKKSLSKKNLNAR